MYYARVNLTIPYIRILCRIACARVNARTLGTHGLVGLSSTPSEIKCSRAAVVQNEYGTFFVCSPCFVPV
jgi:hypothetical protein